MRRGIRTRGEHPRKGAQPRAHRREPEEFEAGQRDEPGGEQDHAGRQKDDAERRGGTEAARESRDAEARRDDGEEREAETRRREVVQDGAHRNGDESDDRQVKARRDDREAERAGRLAPGRRRENGDGEHAVRSQQEAGDDRRAVEDVSGEVVEGSELREVELPPQRVAGCQDGDDDPCGECRHGAVAEVVGGVPGARSLRRGGRQGGDAAAFGICEEGHGTHVLCVRRDPESSTPQVERLGESSRATLTGPQESGWTAIGDMITPTACKPPGCIQNPNEELSQIGGLIWLGRLWTPRDCADGFVSPRGRWWRRIRLDDHH